MPIYYGCTEIEKYFPENALIRIDINNPERAAKTIQEIIKSNYYEENIEAVLEAKELILKKYNFFPFIVNEIKKFEAGNSSTSSKKRILLTKKLKQKFTTKVKFKLKQLLNK